MYSDIYQNSHYDIIGYSCYCANQTITRLRTLYAHQNNHVERPIGTTSWFALGVMGAYFYRLSLFLQYGLRFPIGVKGNEDIIFMQKVGFCVQYIQYRNDFLYIYRMNPTSYTHTEKYDPNNADHVPHAWQEVAEWAYSVGSFSAEQCDSWKRFCLKTAGARILESTRGLAESGVSYHAYKSFIEDSSHALLFHYISQSFLSNWQAVDYKLFITSPLLFYLKYKLIGTVKHILKQSLRIKHIRDIRERKAFPFTFT